MKCFREKLFGKIKKKILGYRIFISCLDLEIAQGASTFHYLSDDFANSYHIAINFSQDLENVDFHTWAS